MSSGHAKWFKFFALEHKKVFARKISWRPSPESERDGMADPSNKWIGVMTARTRNVFISGVATVAVALTITVFSSEASAMTFGGLGRGIGGGMPMANHVAPVMNHVGPSLPMASHVGPTLPAFNHGPSLPMANRIAPVGHGLPTTSVAHTTPTTLTRDVRPTSLSNTGTVGLNRATVPSDRRVDGGLQPKTGTVGTTASIKPGTVARPNLAKEDHPADAGIVRSDLKPNVPVVKPDAPAVVKNDGGPDVERYRFRNLLGKSRDVNIQLSDGGSLHVFCRNDGQIGISCHAPGFVLQFREDKNGELHYIPLPPAKKPVQPSFISLYDPETNTTTTRTFNPDGSHTDVVVQH
jgi:hypothetical protein